MKTTNKLMLVAAVAFTFTMANVTAGEPLLSPRAKGNVIPRTTGVAKTEAKATSYLVAGSPRGREQAESLRKVAGTTENTIDRSFVAGNAKVRDVFGAGNQFQVAPVK